MESFLCITFRFIQPNPRFHGAADAKLPEWPPSPLRAFQALLCAAATRHPGHSLEPNVQLTFSSLEAVAPQIVAPIAHLAEVGYRSYVPHNQTDLVTSAWHRGNQDTSIASHRMEKDLRPNYIAENGDAPPELHYLYPGDVLAGERTDLVEQLRPIARSITHLGWGIDMAVGDARIITAQEAAALPGLRWEPSPLGGTPLRTPKPGTLDDLVRKHADFLNRLTEDGFRPVPPLRVFDVVRYRRRDEPLQRPFRIFELRNMDGSRFRYPHGKLIHLSGMLRHLAIKTMQNHPPRGVDDDWVESFVAGHRSGNDLAEHRQLSYLPLPSLGHTHTDPGIRRVMIVAPIGDDAWLNHIARRLAGQVLQPEGDEFGAREPPMLVPMKRDYVTDCYTKPSNVWHSFTPLVLPGHDDHKPAKTRVLIERALQQSGIDQACEFEWSSFSRFRKSYSAHKYGQDKRPQGYIRPNHLLSQTAVHLTVRFHDGSPDKRPINVPGPIAIGAGRHCGFGLMAAISENG